jgi:hypothetical protein
LSINNRLMNLEKAAARRPVERECVPPFDYETFAAGLVAFADANGLPSPATTEETEQPESPAERAFHDTL